MEDEAIFIEHQKRARAFQTCCHINSKSDGNILLNHVDAYGFLNDPKNKIDQCLSSLVGSNRLECQNQIDRYLKALEATEK